MSRRDEPHRHGSQQTERLSEAGQPAAGSKCSRCTGKNVPSVMGRHTHGSSAVVSLSSPKVDRAGRRTSAGGRAGRVRDLREHIGRRDRARGRGSVC